MNTGGCSYALERVREKGREAASYSDVVVISAEIRLADDDFFDAFLVCCPGHAEGPWFLLHGRPEFFLKLGRIQMTLGRAWEENFTQS